MKSFLPVILLVLSGWLCSCSKSNDSAPPPEEKPISRWAGQDTLLSLYPLPKPYSAVSENDSIAQVTIQDNLLRIKTDFPGTTWIRITDGNQQTSKIKIESRSLEGMWSFAPTPDFRGPWLEAEVESNDPGFSEELKTSFLARYPLQTVNRYAIYFLPQPGAEFKEGYRGADTLLNEGTYSFRNLTLTIHYSDREEVYVIRPAGYSIVGMEQNLTEQYKKMYPDKGITKVVFTRYIYKRTFPG